MLWVLIHDDVLAKGGNKIDKITRQIVIKIIFKLHL